MDTGVAGRNGEIAFQNVGLDVRQDCANATTLNQNTEESRVPANLRWAKGVHRKAVSWCFEN